MLVTAFVAIVKAPFEAKVASPLIETLSKLSVPSCTKICPLEGLVMSVSDAPDKLEATVEKLSVPAPSVVSACPEVPSVTLSWSIPI